MLTVERGGGPQRRTRRLPRPRRRDPGGAVLDLVALAAAAVLVGLGVLNLVAIGAPGLATRQLQVVAIGFALLLVLRWTPTRLVMRLGWACYLVAVAMLVAVAVIGLEANGAKRWLAIGSTTLQPSELAKLGLLLVLADVLGSARSPGRRMVLATVLAAVPITLTLLQPDLSTATLLSAMTVLMMVIGRLPLRLLAPLLAAAAIAAPLAISLLRPYQLARLEGFLTGHATSATGSGWANLQAHIALASGGLLGVKHEPLHQLMAEYLPGRETDLALASLVEQWGMVAGAAAVAAALVLVWRVALAARRPRGPRAALVGAGLAALLGVEVIVSVAGNLGVIPIAGVPFPLLSSGGSAAAVHLAALGFVLGVRREGARKRIGTVELRPAPRPRLVRTTALALSCVLVALAGHGWSLGQRDEAVTLRAAGSSQMSRCIVTPAPRGVITDRHGVALARDADHVSVQAFPSLLLAAPDHIDLLAKLLGQTPAALTRRLRDAGSAVAVKLAATSAAVAAQVDAAGMPEVFSVPSGRRSYPHGALLAPILGFVGTATPADVARWPGMPPGELVGRSGIEQQYDPVLRGIDGRRCVYVDPTGTPVAAGPIRAPVPGADLRLSIDLGLQRRLTADLATALRGAPKQPRGDVGAAVAMDPSTGQVLAMASLPSYDNSIYGPPVEGRALSAASKRRGHPMLEKATQLVAPPGSTFKLVVASAGMVHRWIPPTKVIPTGASYTLGNHTFGNWQAMGPMNLIQSIAWSNDVYFYKLAHAIGPDPIYRVATAMGVGRRTGIDLPGESSGYLGNPASVKAGGGTWYAGSTVILGIGQGYINVTPLQDARWTAAIATGRLVTPRLGLGYTATGMSDRGGAAGAFTPLTATVSTPLPFAAKLGPVRAGMRAAATTGTAAILSTLPVAAGGKTGSAEDPSSPNGAADSWFTAAAPLHNPAIVVTAFVRGGGHGAPTTGPVVRGAMDYFFAHQRAVMATR